MRKLNKLLSRKKSTETLETFVRLLEQWKQFLFLIEDRKTLPQASCEGIKGSFFSVRRGRYRLRL